MQQNTWRDLKLSLERPYKNDNGEPIPTLLDITPEGEFIYESYVNPFPCNGSIILIHPFMQQGSPVESPRRELEEGIPRTRVRLLR